MRKIKDIVSPRTTILFFIFFLSSGIIFAQSWAPIGPGGGGWITAMTVVNDDDNTVYVGCDVGGIYKSTDHGQSWTIKDKGLPMYFMHDIAYDTTQPTTLYLACRAGIFKSTDGGEQWVAKRNGFPPYEEFKHSAPICDIAIDPSNQSTIYAAVGVPDTGYDLESYHWTSVATKGAIYKSTNAGEDWILIHNTGINTEAMVFSVAVDPNDSEIVYAATSTGVYKSVNAGENWTLKNNGIPHGLTMKIVLSPNTANTLYVSIWAKPGSATWQGGIYKSTNGGDDWLPKNTGLPQVVKPERGLTTNFPSLLIEDNPNSNTDVLYTGNIAWDPEPGVFKTVDGGNNWSLVTRPDAPSNMTVGWITEHGVSASILTIDPVHAERLYFGTSVHVFTTDDAGDNWSQAYTIDKGNGYWQGNGLETTVAQTVAIDPMNSDKLYVGYWDIGFLKSIDGGQSFKKVNAGPDEYNSNTFDILIDPDNSAIIYSANGWWEENKGAIYKSTDFGESWTKISAGLPDVQIWSIALDKNSSTNNRTLYVASYEHGIFKSTDGGQTWNAKNNGLGVDNNLRVKKIIIDPNFSQTLYAGIEAHLDDSDENNLQTDKGGIFKSTTGGDTWTRIGTNQITVWDIDIDPTNSQVIYTSVKSEYDHSTTTYYDGGIYKSTDGGANWDISTTGFGPSTNLNVTSVAIDPTNTNILYATTVDQPYHDESSGRGIFKSTNGGTSWETFNEGLSVLYYETIVIDPSDSDIIYAGSSGNGLVKIDLSAPLALEWSFFQVQRQLNNAVLYWATEIEENVSHFEILRRFNGQHWDKIAQINAVGNTTSLQKYQFVDINVPASDGFDETAYYQIRALDFDGTETWNDIKSLYFGSARPTVSLYPNPASNLITIQNLADIDIQHITIYDDAGKLVFMSKKSNQIDISFLPFGTYEVRIETKHGNFVRKLVRQ